jgi:hypothetical protein
VVRRNFNEGRVGISAGRAASETHFILKVGDFEKDYLK